MLARLRHPNILHVHNMYLDSTKEVYMVTEPVSNINILFTKPIRFNAQVCVCVCVCVSLIYWYLIAIVYKQQ